MNNLHISYKNDTGNKAVEEFEIEDLKDKQLISVDAVDTQFLPKQYIVKCELVLPTPEYIEWLENQIK